MRQNTETINYGDYNYSRLPRPLLDGDSGDQGASDILLALDDVRISMQTLLDLLAAFDAVDHNTLLSRLEVSDRLGGALLSWFRSYHDRRTQCGRGGSSKSDPAQVMFGVPQGSVLGPILFLLYRADVLKLIASHNLRPHAYADDTQIYGFCSPSDALQLQLQMSACVDEVTL